MKRILLFLATNLAIIVLLGIVLRLLGVESILDESGTGVTLTEQPLPVMPDELKKYFEE